MSKFKEFIKRNYQKVVATSLMIGFSFAGFANAEEGGSVVTTAIESAANSVKSDAAQVIAAAIGIGVVFWGAKVLWSKFKSMAR